MGVACDGLVGVASCFLNNDFQDRMGVTCGGLVCVAFITSSSWAVSLSVNGCSLALESVILATMCVGWLTVADVRPGPLT